MKTIYIATANKHKLHEFDVMLSARGYTVQGLDTLKEYKPPEETGKTFLENAQIKARALHDFLAHSARPTAHGAFILADDSGLMCDDLDGEPGVKSARLAGPNATDTDNNNKLVALFNDVTHWSRAAHYVCVLVLIKPDGSESHFTGTCDGHIVLVPKGNGGFGYDPHFYLQEFNKTMAEITLAQKNKISHRAKALEKLMEKL